MAAPVVNQPPAAPTTPRVVTNACVTDGARVRRAQENLIALGHLPAGQADGRWGPRSLGALNAFQSRVKVFLGRECFIA